MFDISMQVEANTKEILEIVKANRERHVAIVKDARAGYLEKARELLEMKLAEIKEGKPVDLTINLRQPIDHTKHYDTIIKMLSFHKLETITLGTQEIQNFVEDQWSWTDEFVLTNSVYSPLFKTGNWNIPKDK